MSDYAPATDGSEKSLTDWKNPPKLSELKQDLADAKPSHDLQVTKINTWLDNLNVTGAAQVKTPEGNSQLVPKLIRKQAEWRYGSLSEPFLSTEDLFNVKPMTFNDRDAASQNQVVLNNQFSTKIDKVAFIDEFVRTAVDEGTVTVRVGWTFREEEVEVQVPTVQYRPNPELAPMYQHLAEQQQQDPQAFALDVPQEIQQAFQLSQQMGQPIEAVITGYTTQKQKKTVENRPTVEVCDYRNLIIDPLCKGDLKKARFIIYSFETSKAELQADGKYKNLDKINPDSNSILGEPDHVASDAAAQNFNFNDKPRKKFVVYEYWGYWDIDGTGLVKPFVAAWVGNTLIRLEECPYPDKKLPFVSAQYLPVRRKVNGEPDGALLEENQKIIGAVTRGMIDIMAKSANGQTGVRKDALDVTNRRKFEKGLDYEYNGNVDPRVAFHMHTYPEIPASAQYMLQAQNMEAESLTGVKAFNNGISGQSLGEVAAGIRGALDAASKRELGILRRLSAAIVEIGRKIIAMNAEFLSEQEVVRVTDEEFVQIHRDDLAGNFDLRLSISTAEEDNNKAQELSFMLQTMGNNMDPEMSRMILSDIAVLRKMPDLAKKIREYQPQPDPLVQKQRELEVMLLQAKVNRENAEAEKALAEIQMIPHRAAAEQAKARQLGSAADLNNLDFVEQESGVKQARDLEQQANQTNAQTNMKVLDHHMRLKEKEQTRT